MKIIFFNHWHNGDIHISRGIVRKIIEKIKIQYPNTTFAYSHKCPANLLDDILDLEYDSQAINNVKSEYDSIVKIGDSIYINTWYGQQNWKYIRLHETTFDCLYFALDDSCKQLFGFSLSDISADLREFFPIIDYSKFYLKEAQHWLSLHKEYKILVENGPIFSTQSDPFPMDPIIINLANKYPDKTFILTTDTVNDNLPSNVVYSTNIINKGFRSDLNEVSYLSSHCDMIIGKSSGVFAFSFTQENLFKRTPKYLCFSVFTPKPNKFWLGKSFQNIINYTATTIATNEYNVIKVQNIIDQQLL